MNLNFDTDKANAKMDPKSQESDMPMRIKTTGLDDTPSVRPRHKTQVPPAAPDGGWGWVVVLAGFLIHFILDGIHNTFGIFKDPLVKHFDSDSATVVWASSLGCGVSFLAGKIINEALFI